MDELMNIYQNNELELGKIEEQISLAIKDLQDKQKELVEKNEEIKEKLKLAMEENQIKSYENAYLKITYIAPTTRVTVDSKKLKEKYSDIYQECTKISNVKSSIRIKVKEC